MTDTHPGEIDTATIKPSLLPDERENWTVFHLST